MKNKAKSRTTENGTWDRKRYIKEYKGDIVKNILTIRLHI